MSDFSSCPGCGHKPYGGLSVSHMEIFQCRDCSHDYCHKCPGSNGGRQCPKCQSTSYKTIGKCYAK